ncbi:MAG: molybdate ABC transporter substrate-binding protein [Rubritalea sp.]|tara:strand:- start:10251 stop:11048 length:798 start_codon:yes stop_codon:yes gene_type:complete
MKKLGILLGLLGVLGLCLFLMLNDENFGDDSVRELELHVAAGLQKPVEEIARQYEDECGVKIMLNFGGSGQLLAKLEVAGGDLYLPADASYVDKAREQGMIAESIPVSNLSAGIIIAKGNPQNIKTLQDLTRDDVRVVIAERTAGVGKFTHTALENAGLLEAVENGIISKVATVNEVALQVDLGASDAGIVWDALIPQFKQSEFVRVPDFDQSPNQIQATISVLISSENKAEALKFARFLVASDKGAKVFRKHGFDVQAGDQWEE